MEHTKQTKFFVQHFADQYLGEWKKFTKKCGQFGKICFSSSLPLSVGGWLYEEECFPGTQI